jgi:hypothetical protein
VVCRSSYDAIEAALNSFRRSVPDKRFESVGRLFEGALSDCSVSSAFSESKRRAQNRKTIFGEIGFNRLA